MKVPEGWKVVALETVASIHTGYAKNPGGREEETIVPYLRVANVQDGYLDLTEIKMINIPKNKIDRFLLRKGDVLLTEGGDWDKLGRGAVWEGQIEPCAHQNHVFAVRPDSVLLSPVFLSLQTSSHLGKNYFQSCSKQSTNLASVNSSQLKQFPVILPRLDEQQAIARIIELWDTAVEKSKRLIATKNSLLSRLRERFFQLHPQLKPTSLRSVTTESTTRNQNRLGREFVMAVTKANGIRPMREETISADLTRYKVVHPQPFAYNPMRLNIGSIAMSELADDVLVSPDYVVFECDATKLLPRYLYHLRCSKLWGRFFDTAGSGSVRVRIYYEDLTDFALVLPTIEEQTRVVALLDLAEKDVADTDKLLETYRKQKQGLMQKLLTGQWRVAILDTKETED